MKLKPKDKPITGLLNTLSPQLRIIESLFLPNHHITTHINFPFSQTLRCAKEIKKKIGLRAQSEGLNGLPMFTAGGTAYWSRRTNWYRGSDWTKPKWTALQTITVPDNGNATYRIAKIPIRILSCTFDPFKPDKTLSFSELLVANGVS